MVINYTDHAIRDNLHVIAERILQSIWIETRTNSNLFSIPSCSLINGIIMHYRTAKKCTCIIMIKRHAKRYVLTITCLTLSDYEA